MNLVKTHYNLTMTTCTQLNQFNDSCPMDCGRTSGDCPFRSITIPAELGTDEEGQPYAPQNGAYQNAIIKYEANGHIYIYSSDGIPFIISYGTSGAVYSVNGKTGAVTITLSELGGLSSSEIDNLIASKGYQTAPQVDAAITSKGYQTSQQVDTAITSKGYQTASQVDTTITSKGYQTSQQVESAITSKGYQTGSQVDAKVAAAKAEVEAEIPDVVDSVSSTSTDDALSANQGNVLNTRINNIESRGRYLSTWNCTTGLAGTTPSSLPYTYRTGDYFIVSTTGSTNYKPNGATYTGTASTTVESSAVSVNDTYLYDGTSWTLIHTDVPTIAIDDELSTTSRNPVENRIITGALNGKANQSTTYTKTEVDTALAAKQGTLTPGSNISILNDTISATDTTYSPFTGSTSSAAGTSGLVPTPSAGDNTKFLKGDGTWGAAVTDVSWGDIGGTLSDQTDLSSALSAKQGVLTQGANITILNDTISATDTTYSPFTGATSSAAGTAGLVPAPATTDVDKFLKGDGTWGTVAGGGPTVVQSTGTSTTDVMSQNAVTSMVFKEPDTRNNILIGIDGNSVNGSVSIGRETHAVGTYTIAIGRCATCSGVGAIALGCSGFTVADRSIVIGYGARTDNSAVGSIALGAGSSTTTTGEMNIGTSTTSYGYNNSNYRLLTGLYDGQSAHDAATVAQGNTLATSAPTTSTVGVLGQLYTNTTTGKLYHCTAISGGTYTWEEVGGGGGGTWGSIAGTLSDQTDLQAALDAKQDVVTISNHTLYL